MCLSTIPFLIIIMIFASPLRANSTSACKTHNDFQADLKSLSHQTALIGPDDRELRNASNTPMNIEAAQIRFYCPVKPLRIKGPPTRAMLIDSSVIGNGTLAFDDDIAIVPRHTFVDRNGQQTIKPQECYVEHIATGEIVRVSDGEWPPYQAGIDSGAYRDRDFAVLKLGRKVRANSHINKDQIHIDFSRSLAAKIQIVSNFAEMKHGKHDDLALTITNCQRYGFYRFQSRAESNAAATDCDTGGGSSGSGAYLSVESRPKLIGLVSGEITKSPAGGEFNAANLSTIISQFDQSLFDAYDRLKSRQQRKI